MKKTVVIIGIVLAIVVAGVLIFSPKDNKEIEKTADTSLPAPSGVLAAPGVQQITLTWQAVPGATSYNIYWSTTSPVTKADGKKIPCADTRYVHTGLTGDTAYYYIVSAVNAANESQPSMEAAAVTWLPAPDVAPETEGPPPSEAEFQQQLMNRLMNSERPQGEPPDVGEPTWDPNLETPPPRSEYPDVGEPTWDPNLETPPPKSEWPGENETPQWSPDAEPQRSPTPY